MDEFENSNEPAQAHEAQHNNLDVGDEHRFDYALNGRQNPIRFENSTKLVDYSYYYFPFYPVSTVVFPEEKQPLKFTENEADAYEQFVAAAGSNYFIVLFPDNLPECRIPPFIGTVSRVVQSNPTTRAVELVGVHRCKVVELDYEKCQARAQLLPEIELPPILPKILPKYAIQLPIHEQYSLGTRISGYPFDFIRDVTKTNVEKCTAILKELLAEDIVERALARGLASFSYFVAKQMFSNRNTQYKILKENSADARIATALKYCSVVKAVCNSCRLPLYQKEHILKLSEMNITHVNEHGFVFQITLLSEVTNYEENSWPSFQYTWFPEYAWIILSCRCGQHIGWKYLSQTQDPHFFYGIRNEAVSYCRNNEESEEGVEQFAEE